MSWVCNYNSPSYNFFTLLSQINEKNIEHTKGGSGGLPPHRCSSKTGATQNVKNFVGIFRLPFISQNFFFEVKPAESLPQRYFETIFRIRLSVKTKRPFSKVPL